MRSKSKQTIETTFGKVTVFKNDETFLKRQTPEAFEEAVIAATPSHSISDNENGDNENFFGIEEDFSAKGIVKRDNSNFFDEEFFGDYENLTDGIDSNRTELQSSIKKSTSLSEIDDLNYIDNEYFTKASLEENSSEDSIVRNISTDEIRNDPDFNYIGKIEFF